MSHRSYREESKANWGTKDPRALSNEQIELGAILRIADATEKMASSWETLRKDRDYYKEAYERANARYENIKRSHSALRGAITKLKRGAK